MNFYCTQHPILCPFQTLICWFHCLAGYANSPRASWKKQKTSAKQDQNTYLNFLYSLLLDSKRPSWFHYLNSSYRDFFADCFVQTRELATLKRFFKLVMKLIKKTPNIYQSIWISYTIKPHENINPINPLKVWMKGEIRKLSSKCLVCSSFQCQNSYKSICQPSNQLGLVLNTSYPRESTALIGFQLILEALIKF